LILAHSDTGLSLWSDRSIVLAEQHGSRNVIDASHFMVTRKQREPDRKGHTPSDLLPPTSPYLLAFPPNVNATKLLIYQWINPLMKSEQL
jgi:hypothetical protein